MFYLKTQTIHFILWLYGVGHNFKVKDNSDNERGNTLEPLYGLSFHLAARDILYAPSHRQDTPVEEHWLKQQQNIGQLIHHEGSIC